MSAGVGYRFHMGCGEPLQSRWWITRALGRSATAGQEKRNQPTAGRGNGPDAKTQGANHDGG